MRSKKLILCSLMLLAVGFASVSTVLYINGTSKVTTDSSFSDDVVFTKAQTEEVSETEKGGTARISSDGKTITFATGELSALGDTSTIDFDITNYNTQYGVNATITCEATSGSEDDYSEYVTVTTGKSSYALNGADTVSDKLTVTLSKSALGSDGEGISIGFKCTVSGNAVEETTTAESIARITPENQDN